MFLVCILIDQQEPVKRKRKKKCKRKNDDKRINAFKLQAIFYYHDLLFFDEWSNFRELVELDIFI